MQNIQLAIHYEILLASGRMGVPVSVAFHALHTSFPCVPQALQRRWSVPCTHCTSTQLSLQSDVNAREVGPSVDIECLRIGAIIIEDIPDAQHA